MAAIHARTATLSWIGNVTVTAAPPVLFPMPSGLPGAQTRVSHVAKTGQRLNDRGTEQTLVLLEVDGTGVQSRNTTVRSGLHPTRSIQGASRRSMPSLYRAPIFLSAAHVIDLENSKRVRFLWTHHHWARDGHLAAPADQHSTSDGSGIAR